MLPPVGAVAGIDVGYSATSRSSGVCQLSWDQDTIRWHVARYRAIDAERNAAYSQVLTAKSLLAVALDGPLRGGFDVIGRYRCAERMLTRGVRALIGKPGQSSAPVGIRLNREANSCAAAVSAMTVIRESKYSVRIHPTAIVEAFPSSFLGAMLDPPRPFISTRRHRSDRYFEALVHSKTLHRLLSHLLPFRSLSESLDLVTNHDDRAALVCSLTALCVAGGDFCAVGDADGWIILPPRRFINGEIWSLLHLNAVAEASQAIFISEAFSSDA